MATNVGNIVATISLQNNVSMAIPAILADFARIERAAELSAKNVESSFSRIPNAIRSAFAGVGTALTLGVTAPLVALGASSTSVYKTFDDNMRRVKAATFATGDQYQELINLAKSAGTEMGYTAVDVSDAMVTASQAGIKVEEMASAMPAILGLSRAGATDLNTSVNSLVQIMDVYKLSIDDLQHIGDVIAQGSNESTANITDFTYSLKYAAQEAAPFGISLEQTVAMLMSFADAGIRGTTAGTEIRQALTNTIIPTKRVTQALEEMGLSQDDINIKSRGLYPVLDTLKEKHITLAQAQLLFGTRAGAGMYEVIQKGTAVLEENSQKLENNAGYMKMMTDEMNAGFGGAVRTLNANLTTMKINIGSVLSEGLTPFVNKLNDLVNAFNQADPATQRYIITLAGVVAAIGPILLIIYALTTPLGMLVTAFAALGGAMVVLDQRTGIVSSALSRFYDMLPGIWSSIQNLADRAINAFASIVTSIIDFVDKNDLISKTWYTLESVANRVFAELKFLWHGTKEVYAEFIDDISASVNVSSAWDYIKNAAADLGNYLGDVWDEAIDAWFYFIRNIATPENIHRAWSEIRGDAYLLSLFLRDVWDKANEAWDYFNENIATAENRQKLKAAWNEIKEDAGKLYDDLKVTFDRISELVVGAFKKIGEEVGDVDWIDAIYTTLDTVVDGINNFLGGLLDTGGEDEKNTKLYKLGNFIRGFAEDIGPSWDNIKGIVGDMGTILSNFLDETFSGDTDYEKEGQDIAKGINSITESLDKLGDVFAEHPTMTNDLISLAGAITVLVGAAVGAYSIITAIGGLSLAIQGLGKATKYLAGMSILKTIGGFLGGPVLDTLITFGGKIALAIYKIFAGVGEAIGGALGGAAATLGVSSGVIIGLAFALVLGIGLAVLAYKYNWFGFRDATNEGIEGVKSELSRLPGVISDAIPKVESELGRLPEVVRKSIPQLEKELGRLPEELGKIPDAISKATPKIESELNRLPQVVKDSIPKVKSELNRLPEAFSDAGTAVKTELGRLPDAVTGSMPNITKSLDLLPKAVKDTNEDVTTELGRLPGVISDDVPKITTELGRISKAFTDAKEDVKTELSKLPGIVSEQLDNTKTSINEAEPKISTELGRITEAFTKAKDDIKTELSKLPGIVSEQLQNAKTSISEKFPSISEELGRISKAFTDAKDDIKTELEKIPGIVSDALNTVVSTLSEKGNDLYEAGKKLVQNLIDGIESKYDSLKKSMSKLTSGGVADYLPMNSPSKVGPLSKLPKWEDLLTKPVENAIDRTSTLIPKLKNTLLGLRTPFDNVSIPSPTVLNTAVTKTDISIDKSLGSAISKLNTSVQKLATSIDKLSTPVNRDTNARMGSITNNTKINTINNNGTSLSTTRLKKAGL